MPASALEFHAAIAAAFLGLALSLAGCTAATVAGGGVGGIEALGHAYGCAWGGGCDRSAPLTPIEKASRNNDADEVRKLLPQAGYQERVAAAENAVSFNALAVLTLLVPEFVDANERLAGGDHLLRRAVPFNYAAGLWLLEKGAKPDGSEILELASFRPWRGENIDDCIAFARGLLKRNRKNLNEALDVAVSVNPVIVPVLLEFGATSVSPATRKKIGFD